MIYKSKLNQKKKSIIFVKEDNQCELSMEALEILLEPFLNHYFTPIKKGKLAANYHVEEITPESLADIYSKGKNKNE